LAQTISTGAPGHGPTHVLSDVQSGGGKSESHNLLPHHNAPDVKVKAPPARLEVNRPLRLNRANFKQHPDNNAFNFGHMDNDINDIDDGVSTTSESAPVLEEIGLGMYMQTTATSDPSACVVFQLQVTRPNTRVTFYMSFDGSQNLALTGKHSGLNCRTILDSGESVVVAVLAAQDPDREYALKVRYEWDEVPLVLDSAGYLVPDFTRSVTVRHPPPALYIEPHNHAHVLHGKFPGLGGVGAGGVGVGANHRHFEHPDQFKNPFAGGEQTRLGGHGHGGHMTPPRTPPNMGRQGAARPHTPPMQYRSPAASPSSMRAQQGSQPRNFNYSRGQQQQQHVQQQQHGGLPPFPFHSVAALLTHLGMPQYIATFEREELSLSLLLSMAENERVLKANLKDVGVAKLGQREKIAMMLRPYVNGGGPGSDMGIDETF
jgi:hypothetical protein